MQLTERDLSMGDNPCQGVRDLEVPKSSQRSRIRCTMLSKARIQGRASRLALARTELPRIRRVCDRRAGKLEGSGKVSIHDSIRCENPVKQTTANRCLRTRGSHDLEEATRIERRRLVAQVVEDKIHYLWREVHRGFFQSMGERHTRPSLPPWCC